MTFASVFDIIIAFIVATLAIRGVLRGFSGEIFSLLGTVGGVILAWKYSTVTASWIRSWFPDANGALVSVGAMVLIYVTVVISAALLCRMVKAFLKLASLTFVDRMLGFGAGVLKGGLLVLFLYVGITTYSPFLSTEWMGASVIMRGANAVWPDVQTFLERFGFFPEEFTLPSLNLPYLYPLKDGEPYGS